MPKRVDPFDLNLDDEQRKTLGLWLQTELYNALAAKSALDLEVDYWHRLYEQARYTPDAEPLSAEQMAIARRELGYLAGELGA